MHKEICKYCEKYYAYYKERASGFQKLEHGECSKSKNIMKEDGTCNSFKVNMARETRKKNALKHALESALVSIHEIAQILKNES